MANSKTLHLLRLLDSAHVGRRIEVVPNADDLAVLQRVEPYDLALERPSGCTRNPGADENRSDVVAVHEIALNHCTVVAHRLAQDATELRYAFKPAPAPRERKDLFWTSHPPFD